MCGPFSIGLHPKDNVKMIDTLRSLRDLGNTVIVVEHDEETIRAADHVLELGPGPGIHGGEVVAAGRLQDVLGCPQSPTGQYLSGAKRIDRPAERRKPNGKALAVRGARANNLKNIDVEIPLGQFVCVSGASGSGKSTLVGEILYKELWKRLVEPRSLSGDHDALEGVEQLTRVVNIDQTPHRPQQPLQPLHLCWPLRSNPGATVQFQREGRALRGVPRRGRDRHPALLHAGRGSGVRRLQGTAFQRRDAAGGAQGQEHARKPAAGGSGVPRALRQPARRADLASLARNRLRLEW